MNKILHEFSSKSLFVSVIFHIGLFQPIIGVHFISSLSLYVCHKENLRFHGHCDSGLWYPMPSTWEPEEGGSLQVLGHSGLHSKFWVSLNTDWDPVSKQTGILYFIYLLFWHRISLCTLGWPGTCSSSPVISPVSPGVAGVNCPCLTTYLLICS